MTRFVAVIVSDSRTHNTTYVQNPIHVSRQDAVIKNNILSACQNTLTGGRQILGQAIVNSCSGGYILT
jgi:hypothetical protein